MPALPKGPTGFFPGKKNVFSLPPQAAVPGMVERTATRGSDSLAGVDGGVQCGGPQPCQEWFQHTASIRSLGREGY